MTMEGELKMLETEYQTKMDAMRREMRTLPSLNNADDSTKFYKGVEGVEVELIEAPLNPYKVLFELAVATWGDERFETQWARTSPENRFRVVKAVLSGHALPTILESINFQFIVRKVSRAAFDQHARQRFSCFFSIGTRDNSRLDAGVRIPTTFYHENPTPEQAQLLEDVKAHHLNFKKLYKRILNSGMSFEDARVVVPEAVTHHYKFASNYSALKMFLGQRLQACEMADIVATAILVRLRVEERFPLLASHLTPGCDKAKKCTYRGQLSSTDTTSVDMFSALFSGCERWPDRIPYATFHTPCSSYEKINTELGTDFKNPKDWVNYKTLESLPNSDMIRFGEGWEFVGDQWKRVDERALA